MQLIVNGLPVDVRYDRRGIDDLLVPRLRSWMDATDDGRRHIAFLAAPPGSGKSTLAALLEQGLQDRDFQAVGIDGFHRPARELKDTTFLTPSGERKPLDSIKGAPETFDVARLERLLKALHSSAEVLWPSYDRTIHDVVADGTMVTARHILLEGNWLLLDAPGWRDLRHYADFTIFITADEELLRHRLISRKIQGGLSAQEAESFYQRSDAQNVRRTLTESQRDSVDLTLAMDADGALHETEKA